RRLRPFSRGDRVPPDRRPGLRAGDGAVAGRRFARAHQALARSSQRNRREKSRGRQRDRDFRRVRARQQFDAGNAGGAYVVLKDWSERGKGEVLRSLFQQFNRDFAAIEQARIWVFPPPPIQGIGNAGGFAMQLELRDGSFDLTKLQTTTNTVVKDAQTQSGL